jgi:hypothetical protein
MKYALIFVDKKDGAEFAYAQEIEGFVTHTTGIKLKAKGSRRLGERSWLLERDGDRDAFGKIVAQAVAHGLDYELWYMDQA